MTLTSIKEKFERGIELAKNLEEISYIEEKLKVTSQINRRTKAGRELTAELSDKLNEKARLLINQGELPFKNERQ